LIVAGRGLSRTSRFFELKPELADKIPKQAKSPLKDAVSGNTLAGFNFLKDTGQPDFMGCGWPTKFSRLRFNILKSQAL
jgi:hypothetical protein